MNKNMKILIVGNGYVGNRCLQAWPEAILTDKIISTKEEALELLEKYQPDAVFNAAGITGTPNVDWCETNQVITMMGNTVLPIILGTACFEKGIYFLHIGSGCVFYGDSPNPFGWHEDDFANPSAVYTRSKYAADLTLTTLPNVGIGRIRMPIDDVPGPKNLIDKLAAYPKVIDVENSVTVVEDMINVFRGLLEKQAPGIFHVVNPGKIRHKEIIAMYEELVDPSHFNEWISEEDLVKQGLADKKRSNNIMQSNNLVKVGLSMRPIKEALRDTLMKYAKNKNKGNLNN
jgi:3,5-epimerase/4-reductase